MVIGEFGGPKPGDDNPLGAGHNQDSPQTARTLFEHVADQPPTTLQGYLTEQQYLSVEADRLRSVLRNSTELFAAEVLPFLDSEITLGNFARAQQNNPRPDLLMNFTDQAQWGKSAEQMKNTLQTEGAGRLNDPGIRQSVDLYLQSVAVTLKGL